MGNPVAHAAHRTPFHLREARDGRRIVIHQLRRRLAKDDNVEDHRLLRALVGKKILLGQAFDIGDRLIRSFAQMLQQLVRRRHAHIGRASASTASRMRG